MLKKHTELEFYLSRSSTNTTVCRWYIHMIFIFICMCLCMLYIYLCVCVCINVYIYIHFIGINNDPQRMFLAVLWYYLAGLAHHPCFRIIFGAIDYLYIDKSGDVCTRGDNFFGSGLAQANNRWSSNEICGVVKIYSPMHTFLEHWEKKENAYPISWDHRFLTETFFINIDMTLNENLFFLPQ